MFTKILSPVNSSVDDFYKRGQLLMQPDKTVTVFYSRHSYLILLLIILILASFLRLYKPDMNGMWVDESNTVIIAHKDLPGIVEALSHDASPPLYYGILHYWMAVFGDSETAIRSLSAFFGILLTGVLYMAGSVFFNRKTGLFAALFCAVSPLQIMYSQQARMYSLLPLASLLAFFFFFLLTKSFNRKNLIFCFFFTLCTVFVHHYGFLMIPVLFLLIFFSGDRKLKAALLAITLAGAIIKYKLWLPSLLHLARHGVREHSGWMAVFWKKYGFFGYQFKSFESFTPGGPLPPYIAMNSMPDVPLFPVVLCILLFFAALSPVLFFKKHSNAERSSFFKVAVYGFLPLFCAALYSLLISPAYLAGRCDQVVFPAFCLIFASGIYYLKNRYAQVIAVIMILACSFLTLRIYYSTDIYPGDRMIAQSVRSELKPGDSIICTALTRASLQYYLRDKKKDVRFYSFPEGNATHLAWHRPEEYLKKPEKLKRDAFNIGRKIEADPDSNGRIFIIYEHHNINAFLPSYFQKQLKNPVVRASKWIPQSGTRAPAKVILIEKISAASPPDAKS